MLPLRDVWKYEWLLLTALGPLVRLLLLPSSSYYKPILQAPRALCGLLTALEESFFS